MDWGWGWAGVGGGGVGKEVRAWLETPVVSEP